MRQRRPRIENEPHRRFVAGLPCLICGAESQAAHVSYSDLSIAKPGTGMASKADDCFVVPLCPRHHEAQHHYGREREWWQMHDIDPIKVSLRLFSVSGDQDRGEEIARAANVID